ncbi:hypothetical protein GS501_00765 [Saccharibacter sp. 17.LH.SD]|uniref:hypothetical protein n=1 Tax=Saccharibacter sp. 17.LH.SD TaxID=2689393 RepID=UPI00137139E8|nr:hypothetical protein [Saccharibacter sp. 17.LH.SD]MXV43610.1 hypothetical protein [Saccharibacter sp. 17.LH.SD]
MRRYILALLVGIGLVNAGGVWADDEPNKLTMHQVYRSSSLPHTAADFSMFHFVPRGDKMVTEPEHGRLLFQTPDGRPDGYGERRGTAIVYYDRTGKAVRVQHLTQDEIDRLNQQ